VTLPLTSWPPKFIFSCHCPMDQLCPLTSKSLHSFSKKISCSPVLVTDGQTNRQTGCEHGASACQSGLVGASKFHKSWTRRSKTHLTLKRALKAFRIQRQLSCIVPHRIIWSWFTDTDRWWVGCYSWHSKEGNEWAGPQPSQALHRCTKCNSPPINGQYTNHRIAV